MVKVADKRSAILNTALELLVENGFHNTPMSLIAKEAGVSAGIIYHYFESKDELIHQLYREIVARFATALALNNSQELDGLALIRQVWLNAYQFYIHHPKETVFMEQYKNSPFYKSEEETYGEEAAVLEKKLQSNIAAGKIVDLPIIVIYSLTLGVAMALAKHQISGIANLDKQTLEKVADAVCRSVRPA